MFPRFHAGARAAGLCLVAALLAACGSGDAGSDEAGSAAPVAASSRLVVDTASATPVAGGTLTLKASVLGADGLEIKGASFSWTSSDESVAVVASASETAADRVADKVAQDASMPAPVGTYATVRTLRAGAVDITATATFGDGSRAASVTHLVVQPEAAITYTLALSPSALTIGAGGAPQRVTAVVLRSDGADGVGDLANWNWSTDNATFVATPAADGRSAGLASPASATLAGTGALTACADTPGRERLCANVPLARPETPLPAIAFSAPSVVVKPGRTGTITATLSDAPQGHLAGLANLAWSIQQTGSAAVIAGAADGATVAVSSDATQLSSYSGSLTLTASYPDGRTHSASLPLSSPGPWHRLPDAPIDAPTVTSLAIDGTRVWRLSADGSQPARLERFAGVAEPAREPAEALPGNASRIWYADNMAGRFPTVVVQMGADTTNAFGRLDADFDSPRAHASFSTCASQRVPTGRRFVVATDGVDLITTAQCSTTWFVQRAGQTAVLSRASVPLLTDMLPMPNGSAYGLDPLYTTRYRMEADGVLTSWTHPPETPLNVGAFSHFGPLPTASTSFGGPNYGFRNGAGLVVRDDVFAPFRLVFAHTGPVTNFRVFQNFVAWLAGPAMTLFDAGALATVPLTIPGTGTVLAFEGAVDGNGKARLAAQMSDGAVWVYDQP
ncbi:hypothetical protein CURE108131_03045 [Cupriavidus respiraculi]|uniref:BIG2 domain-containing protein n=1 Tax=Cupriavidus respiraculi TaxID=195930 RepID=A0ABN7Y3Y6_9BURK|nr:hypothetical protein [Cupriavidus respiraculi]CAG9166660.1 hypothetical protein LMG21510_00481 [Cupriavidus respiraculi]